MAECFKLKNHKWPYLSKMAAPSENRDFGQQWKKPKLLEIDRNGKKIIFKFFDQIIFFKVEKSCLKLPDLARKLIEYFCEIFDQNLPLEFSEIPFIRNSQ